MGDTGSRLDQTQRGQHTCLQETGWPLMEPARGVLPAPDNAAMGTGAQFSAFSGEVLHLIFDVVSPNIYSWQLRQTS